MSIKNIICSVVLFFCVFPAFVFSQSIDFENKQWDVSQANVEVTQHMNRQVLLMKSGTIFLEGVELQDGVIEVDIAPTQQLVFGGIVFRAQSQDNLEDVYLRLNKSGLPDAVQYTPRYNGISGWQLYNGEGFTAATTYPRSRWINLRIVVKGMKAEIFVDGSEKPVLTSTLKREPAGGKIGLWGIFGAYFSNFSYTKTEPDAIASDTEMSAPENYLTEWEISQVFQADSVDSEEYPSESTLRSFSWNTIGSEPSGLINISKMKHINEANGGDALVYARAVIESDSDQTKKLSFGYSDEVSVFLNGKLLFSGNSRWRSRDIGFNGIVGLNDHLYLDLKEGKNELVFAVTEWFGGWGYMARLK